MQKIFSNQSSVQTELQATPQIRKMELNGWLNKEENY